jgi:hypothetical protein
VTTACCQCGLPGVAPHELRRTCARLCHDAGGESSRSSTSSVTKASRQLSDTLAASSGSETRSSSFGCPRTAIV